MVEWGFMKFAADAQLCYEEVQTLGEKYTPQQVVDLARNPETELHKCFQWDDSVAAENWRRQQARQVCSSFTVRVQTVRKSEPKTFRVVQHDPEERVYKPVTFTLRNPDEYARLLTQAKSEMKSFRDRYKSLVELESVITEIDRALYA